MISRRNVRIKVMQLLFALSRDEDLTFDLAKSRYWEIINSSYTLMIFNLLNILEICRANVDDAEKRGSKYLPTEYDKIFSDKLWNNPLIQALDKNSELKKEFKNLGFENLLNSDLLAKIYTEFTKEESFIEFQKATVSNESVLEILLELYRFCRKNEYFNEIMEDQFPSWLDDKSLIVGSIKKCLKCQPAEDPLFFKKFKPEDETVKEFGEELLSAAYTKDEDLLAMIKPTLENWDHERVAILDMILIKMAICEFTMFPSIPSKVTLNEYVEIAKNYSTAKSKDFINGILDKLLNELTKEGKVIKSGRGLLD